jgi:1,2-dihydroxy-3,5-cyclohexadiene-1,4-dicarboxylate dehydrogenase
MTSVRLALAMGDPNGIGPEIVLKAVAAIGQRVNNSVSAAASPEFIIYGPQMVLAHTAKALGLERLLTTIERVDVGAMSSGDYLAGTISAAAGVSTVASATAALQACRQGKVSAVIAAPHHETAIAKAGIDFSGYPSLVASVCGVPPEQVFLMLVGGGLRIVHATLHESVQSALDRLTPALVIAATKAGAKACALLGLKNPKIGLFGINPHASEGQLFGDEDFEIVEPAAAYLRAEGYTVDGPKGADLLLSLRQCDVYVAMFHDQGHIPIKLLAPNAASALSIGADALLSSVGHGSAMDIAGKGVADPTAMIRTIDMLSLKPV